MIRTILSFVLSVLLAFGPELSYAQSLLPQPGSFLSTSPSYMPMLIKGMKVHENNPFLFDFIVTPGDSGLRIDSQAFKDEGQKLIKYFLAALTIKEKDLWVNLSPYEQDRMLSTDLGQTEMGQEMLAQDYLLKQLTASFMHPDKDLGRQFWAKVYSEAQRRFGTSEVPVDTFNKVWIMADKAKVFEKDGSAFVVASHLKVMLESDYVAASCQRDAAESRAPARDVAMSHQKEIAKSRAPARDVAMSHQKDIAGAPAVDLSGTEGNISDLEADLSKQLIREIILPAIEQEVNEGANFAPLRQMFYSMILATWYKQALKDALLNQVYTDKGKTGGVATHDPQAKDAIYQQYLEAYRKGAVNLIKEEADPVTGDMAPHKYFSGGVAGEIDLQVSQDAQDPEVIALASTGLQDAADLRTNLDPMQAKNHLSGKVWIKPAELVQRIKEGAIPAGAIIDIIVPLEVGQKLGVEDGVIADATFSAINDKTIAYYRRDHMPEAEADVLVLTAIDWIAVHDAAEKSQMTDFKGVLINAAATSKAVLAQQVRGMKVTDPADPFTLGKALRVSDGKHGWQISTNPKGRLFGSLRGSKGLVPLFELNVNPALVAQKKTMVEAWKSMKPVLQEKFDAAEGILEWGPKVLHMEVQGDQDRVLGAGDILEVAYPGFHVVIPITADGVLKFKAKGFADVFFVFQGDARHYIGYSAGNAWTNIKADTRAMMQKVGQVRLDWRDRDNSESFAAQRKLEKAGAMVIKNLMTTPLDPNSPDAGKFTNGGYGQDGFDVPARAAMHGSFAVGNEGDQGYYVDQTNVEQAGRRLSGREVFLAGVQSMRDWYEARRPRIIEKMGIGGQYVPFQGIADVFHSRFPQPVIIEGVSELDLDWKDRLWEHISTTQASWDEVALVPSSKSGSTDETMLLFVKLLGIVMESVADMKGHNGESVASKFKDYLHEINFDENGKERPGSELFTRFNFDELVKRVGIDEDELKSILRTVLMNTFFESVNNPGKSRLAAFIQNAGLAKVLGPEVENFGRMFDNVGGRWTADLHMMLFLAVYGLDAEAYWNTRYEGIKQFRSGDHPAIGIADRILNEKYKQIVMVVPDDFFMWGKSVEQTFNESSGVKDAPNLRCVPQSLWGHQTMNYMYNKDVLVWNFTDMAIPDKLYNVETTPVRSAATPQELAGELGRLFTLVYGVTTETVTQLMVRALAAQDFEPHQVDISKLDEPATKVFRDNLPTIQVFVEFGKKLLDKFFGDLQVQQQVWKKDPQGASPLDAYARQTAGEAHQGLVRSALDQEVPATAVTAVDIQRVFEAGIAQADQDGKNFALLVYLGGSDFRIMRADLMRAGYPWVMQGTGDQHISLNQVLSQPDRFVLGVVSFVPEKGELIPAEPAIGFAKGQLHDISPSLVNHQFGVFTYEAFTRMRGGKGFFINALKTDERIDAVVQGAQKAAVLIMANDLQRFPSKDLDHAENNLPFEVKALRPVSQTRPVKFGTSGDRGKIGKDFDALHVARLAQGTADYFKDAEPGKIMLIGYDPREGNAANAKMTADILAANGVRVMLMASKPTPTPVLAFLAQNDPRIGGVINFTASHNPWTDNGYKFSPSHGGAAPKAVTDALTVAANANSDHRIMDHEKAVSLGLIDEMLPEWAVHQYVQGYIIPGLKEVGAWQDIVSLIAADKDFHLVVDAMNGTAGDYLRELYTEIGKAAGRPDFYTLLNPEPDPKFASVNGEPRPDSNDSRKGLVDAVNALGGKGFGASVDGDSDRFGNIDPDGTFVPANDMMALIAWFLKKEIGLEGAMGKTVATSNFMNAIAAALGIPLDEEAVGFKYFVDNTITQGRDYLVAGEESAHTMAKPFNKSWDDGIVVGLMGLWMRAKSGKSLMEYKEEIFKALDKRFLIETMNTDEQDGIKDIIDAKIAAAQKEVKAGVPLADISIVKEVTAAGYKVVDLITKDGLKMVLENGNWLLVRPSGTQNLVKVYVEVVGKFASSEADLQNEFKTMTAVGETLIGGYAVKKPTWWKGGDDNAEGVQDADDEEQALIDEEVVLTERDEQEAYEDMRRRGKWTIDTYPPMADEAQAVAVLEVNPEFTRDEVVAAFKKMKPADPRQSVVVNAEFYLEGMGDLDSRFTASGSWLVMLGSQGQVHIRDFRNDAMVMRVQVDPLWYDGSVSAGELMQRIIEGIDHSQGTGILEIKPLFGKLQEFLPYLIDTVRDMEVQDPQQMVEAGLEMRLRSPQAFWDVKFPGEGLVEFYGRSDHELFLKVRVPGKVYQKHQAAVVWQELKPLVTDMLRAMLPADHAATNKIDGGIDLNGNDMAMDVEKSGRGVAMTFDPAMADKLRQGDFTGLMPVIIQVTPYVMPAPKLGLQAPEPALAGS